ncbi:tripartite tricarboxylate transporter substrate binding protein [Ramlibacter sp. G-1-2-2]|uniref:Tripartite tricarboxylate transporter substrate binding protein n=1 Tax=Ramlibacter agri TaxID=2728837 RepID=A0A848HAV5_9BURK|nr:tripartite tricarboxylate transporter substrate binding protein [Ramlibacter agri]NML46639.1 tripartite tricarboxylate transporter substrate binding protein [Ramlibacter agri]
MRRSTFLRFAAGSALLPSLAFAETYPDKPVRIINPFPPGSPVDAVGRLMAQRLGTVWKEPVIVESKSGAGGTVGAAFVASAPADGATLLVTTQSPITVAPLIYKSLTYDPARDFTPVWGIASSGLVIVVTPGLQVHTLAELVQYAKAHPKEVAYASSGAGTVQHLAGELFIAKTGAPLLHVPYRGGAPAATDLIAGQVQVMFDSLSNQLANIKAGRVRALAVMRPTRAGALPDVPTTTEAGAPGVQMRGWIGVLAPKAMPAASLATLRADALRTMKGPEVARTLGNLGLDGEILDAEKFGQYITADAQQIGEIVRSAHIQLDAPNTR